MQIDGLNSKKRELKEETFTHKRVPRTVCYLALSTSALHIKPFNLLQCACAGFRATYVPAGEKQELNEKLDDTNNRDSSLEIHQMIKVTKGGRHVLQTKVRGWQNGSRALLQLPSSRKEIRGAAPCIHTCGQGCARMLADRAHQGPPAHGRASSEAFLFEYPKSVGRRVCCPPLCSSGTEAAATPEDKERPGLKVSGPRGGTRATATPRTGRGHRESLGRPQGHSRGTRAGDRPGPRAPGREEVSTHPWARWRVPGESRRPLTPGALGWALSEAVGGAHGGARPRHPPERPAAGRERRENGWGWPLPGAVAEAGSWSRDERKGGREAHAQQQGRRDGDTETSLLWAKSANLRTICIKIYVI
ncbi:uncharacterized protein [Equus caballus]|uniref:uncharacterized protein n=1 Tax=Equus caballus TaxID=9796 RepID=UPI0038B2AFB3